ncbi:polyamine aminopropyltransferase [Pseudomarimonas arenosa]|uniref:Polyamine aminopropyltransferase n=1 Tax=Pseudomarimonas arenosa TaxID=2774145 RepID=A0AAW3ZLM2_9GAMM|nr:polyamine aminopropyltransferase [Pseudomarimonas arenosa]MBD8527043.1 polyamine aminopropyltransferase [Pseudomarimonas arenosa]
MTNAPSWFNEQVDYSGSSIGFRVTKKLHEEQSAFQKIEIWETTDWGNLMVLDGCIMLTSRDNFLYHEMMAHPALFSHSNPKRVVVIGGGDCGTLREVLRHREVESAVQVEIDERVTRMAEQYFPELCEANNDPRAQLLFDDGIAYMRDAAAESIDVIIVDSTDPVGPAEGLFNEAFYQTCYKALRPGGILVQQSEPPLTQLALIKSMRQLMRQVGFAAVRTIPFPQPAYPTGWWSCTMARKGADLSGFRERGAYSKPFATRYYSADIHKAAMILPEFLREALGE